MASESPGPVSPYSAPVWVRTTFWPGQTAPALSRNEPVGLVVSRGVAGLVVTGGGVVVAGEDGAADDGAVLVVADGEAEAGASLAGADEAGTSGSSLAGADEAGTPGSSGSVVGDELSGSGLVGVVGSVGTGEADSVRAAETGPAAVAGDV